MDWFLAHSHLRTLTIICLCNIPLPLFYFPKPYWFFLTQVPLLPPIFLLTTSPHYCVYSFPCVLMVCSCDSIHWILWEKQCNNMVKSSDSRARLKLNPGSVTYWLCGLCYLSFLCPNFLICQFSSVAQSCPILCNSMNRSMPGLPVHHQLPESTQTHVCWVGDAIQPPHPLLSPSPPALNLSQHEDLFKWVSSSDQVAKVLEFQLQHQSYQSSSVAWSK